MQIGKMWEHTLNYVIGQGQNQKFRQYSKLKNKPLTEVCRKEEMTKKNAFKLHG